ncbi:glycosyltransferase family 4 protein [Pseudoroseicyclus aestuarii]|uniref:Glycosyltransferase involved in cell wall biosynthesis n=1 Tax=Pseudoroseicyclus aestuarii TaxID=1795041 RepID=A0A318SZG0_9RHOB|nr:glycosyltransferase family 4 protein [Pseudoroseicyclus aestuarii]PYE82167.1 glycosyltransferase involved in cell wall biosynthesis [Pseudoroseicyclus aestuarii]
MPQDSASFPAGDSPARAPEGEDARRAEGEETGRKEEDEAARRAEELARIAPFFDAAFYLKRNPDVAAAGMDPLQHFHSNGWREGRNPHPNFALAAYLARFPALREEGRNPLLHFADYHEGLAQAELRPARPATDTAPALPAIALTPPAPQDLMAVRPFFDEAHYRAQLPELAGSPVDPLVHYMTIGWIEERDPSPEFSTRYYLRRNSDVREKGLNPFLHWCRSGRHEPHRQSRSAGAEEARLLEVFETGPLAAAVADVETLEPMVAFPANERRVTGPQLNRPLGESARQLRETLGGRHYRTVVLVPHVRMSGGARLAGAGVRALAELEGPDEVLVLRTDGPEFDYPEWYPAEVRQIDLSALIADLPEEQRLRLLIDVLNGVGARRVINFNSRLAWDAFGRYGRQMAQLYELTSYLFCWDVTLEGDRTGYPIQWLRQSADFHARLLTDSEFLSQDLRARFGFEAGRVTTLPTPIRTGPEVTALPRNPRPRALWAGRHDRQKRLDVLVAVARANPQIDFHVYGKPVLDQAGIEAFDPPFNILVRPPYRRLEEVLPEGFDFYLYTSQWDGLPNAVLEAGAAGLPLVAPAVGGIPELIDDRTGWLVPECDDVAGYSARIRALLDDPEAALSRARALQRRLAERHAPEHYSAALKDALEKDLAP